MSNREWTNEEIENVLVEMRVTGPYVREQQNELVGMVLSARADAADARREIQQIEIRMYDYLGQLNNATSVLARLGWWSCTIAECNCNSFHPGFEADNIRRRIQINAEIEILEWVNKQQSEGKWSRQTADKHIAELRKELECLQK
jgi:hypothetical protein